MNPINDGADNTRSENNVPPRPPDGALAPPRRPTREFSFWTIELNRDHLSDGALARATRGMEAALYQNTKYEAFEWGNNGSRDYNYPGTEQ